MARVTEVPYGDDADLLRQAAGDISTQVQEAIKRTPEFAQRLRLQGIRAAVAKGPSLP